MPFKIVKEKDGWFVINSITNKKYNKQPHKRKIDASNHMKALYSNIEEGGILNPVSFIKDRISGFTKGKRYDYSPSVRDYLAKNGNNRIIDIQLYRTPLQKWITKVLNGMSLTQFNNEMKKRGFDEMYHLFIKVRFQGGFARIEKNEVIEIQDWNPKYETDQNAQTMHIQMDNNILNRDNGDGTFGITINSLLNDTRKAIGDELYFMYDPFENNCQNFIINILNFNGLLDINPKAKDFIYQDITGLDKQLPFTHTIAKGITDLGAKVNILLKGRGLDLIFENEHIGY